MAKPVDVVWSGACVIRAKPNPAKLICELSPFAEDAVADLAPGCRILGLTLGRFSFGDLIRAVCRKTGPADVTISTWTAGLRDLETMAWVLERKRVKSIRFMVGDGFVSCCRPVAHRMVELYGGDALVLARTHAKFAMIDADGWKIVIRTSMNLSRNPRIEQFELDDDPEIFAFYDAVCQRVRDSTPPGIETSWKETNTAFASVLSDTPTEDEVASDAVDVEALVADLLSAPPDVQQMIADLAW